MEQHSPTAAQPQPCHGTALLAQPTGEHPCWWPRSLGTWGGTQGERVVSSARVCPLAALLLLAVLSPRHSGAGRYLYLSASTASMAVKLLDFKKNVVFKEQQ